MRLRALAAGALALALSACVTSRGLHPTGQALDPAGLKTGRSFAEVKLSPAAWPAEDWWRALGDAQLDALIDEALRDNPGLAAADARARQAQAEVLALNAERGPEAGLDVSALGARLSSNSAGLYPAEGVGTFGWLKTAEVNFSWGLDLWGGKRAAWEAAVGRGRAAEVERREARIQLSVNVALAYVRLRQAFAEREIAEADRERTRRIEALTRTYIAGGLGNPDSAHQVSTEAGVADQRVAQADEAVDAARTSLAVLLGKGPDRGLDIAAPGQLKPVALAVPADLPMELLGRRPDLVAARWRVEAAGHDIKAAKARFLPNISISAMAGFVALGDSVSVWQLPSRTYSVGPALSLPIFDGGRLRANLGAADAEYDQAVAEYNQALVRAVNEVADLLSALKSVDTQIAIQRDVLRNAQRAWDDAQVRYQGGLGTELDTLIVRRQLLVAEQNMAALAARQSSLSVRLIDALGGGFQPAPGQGGPKMAGLPAGQGTPARPEAAAR
jgi:NodT family efflux transporter outer membrane factor (OMF) lipoprotein